MKYKACILSIIGILVLATNLSSAADQTLDRNEIYELREKCGKTATEFFKRYRFEGDGLYQNHYNTKLNICFIDISDVPAHNKRSSMIEQLVDVNENKIYAAYSDDGDRKMVQCYVGTKDCMSGAEFHELIKPYMTE